MKWKTAVILAVCCLITGCSRAEGTVFTKAAQAESAQTAESSAVPAERTEKGSEKESPERESQKEALILVHVCGAVANPGVYSLNAGARVCDAVEMAGGFTEDAAGDAVNQAAFVSDGQRLYIWTVEEAQTAPEGQGPREGLDGGAALTEAGAEARIDLNRAAKEELMSLPGIGEAKALDIIAYREENGGFKTIEEIMNIKGIKEAVFTKIKDKIVVQ